MNRMVFMLVILLLPISCAAEGWSDLSGLNKDGMVVNVYPAWDSWNGEGPRDYSKEENRKYYKISVSNRAKGELTTFEEQVCYFQEDSEKIRVGFWCAENAKTLACHFKGAENDFCYDSETPLSGVTYKIAPNMTDDFWAYESEFTCVKGCEKNSKAPQKMYMSHWEGGEPKCKPHKETDVSTKEEIDVRDKPSISGQILTKYAGNSKVRILERDKTCRTYLFNGDLVNGQWVRVNNASNKSAISGWIFDAYVEYPEVP